MSDPNPFNPQGEAQQPSESAQPATPPAGQPDTPATPAGMGYGNGATAADGTAHAAVPPAVDQAGDQASGTEGDTAGTFPDTGAAQSAPAVPQYAPAPEYGAYIQPPAYAPTGATANGTAQPTPQYGQTYAPGYGQGAQPQPGQDVPQYGQADQPAATPQYGQQQSAPYQPQAPYGQPSYGAPYDGQPQYGQGQYGQDPYGQTDPQPQYGQPGPQQHGQNPYDQPQPGQPAYGQNPYAQPYGTPLPQGMPQYAGAGYPYGEPAANMPWYGINLAAATKRFFAKYTVFTGRASRGEFWWPVLMYTLVSVALGIVSVPFPSTVGTVIGYVWLLICLVPFISVGVRRLHDTNRSGWLILLPLVPWTLNEIINWVWIRPVSDDIVSMWAQLSSTADSEAVYAALEHTTSMIATPVMISTVCSLVYLISGIALMVTRSKPEGARFDVGTYDQPGQYNQSNQYGQPNQSDQYGQAGSTDQAGQSNQYGQSGQYGQADQPADHSDQAGQRV